MAQPVTFVPVTGTEGRAAKQRRMRLKVSREALAREAGVSPSSVKNYEEGSRENMTTAPAIEAALARLEARAATHGPIGRRSTDTPNRQIVDAVVGTAEGELTIRVLSDGTRAIFIVPPGGHVPSDEEIERVLRDVRGE